MFTRCKRIARCAICCVVLLVPALVASAEQAVEPSSDLFDWGELPLLPGGVEGAFTGISDGAIVVAGGSGGADGVADTVDFAHRYRDTVLVLDSGSDTWVETDSLVTPRAFGGSLDWDNGVLCLGGQTATGPSDEITLLRWDRDSARLHQRRLADLPEPMTTCSAVYVAGRVYVVGTRQIDGEANAHSGFCSIEATSLVQGENATWKQHPPVPGNCRFYSAVVAQSEHVYVIGGCRDNFVTGGDVSVECVTEAYRFPVSSQTPAGWSRIADMPVATAAAASTSIGGSSFLIIGGFAQPPVGLSSRQTATANASSNVLVYESITDTWTNRGNLPSPVAMSSAVRRHGSIAIIAGRTSDGSARRQINVATNRPPDAALHWPDYLVLLVYLLILLGIGYLCTGRESGAGGFLLGSRRIPWWAAGLSIVATQVSSIGFMAIPAKSFATDWIYLTGSLTSMVVIPIVVRFYMPFFHQPNITTAYEYLERRFSVFVRLYGSLAFIVLQLGRMAIVLYLPAIALSVVTGMDVYVSILIMGALSTAYTVMGGIEAVIWTDVLQAVVLMGGAAFGGIVAVSGTDGGLSEFWTISQVNQKLRMINWDTSIATTAIWVVLVGNVFQRTADLTADQTVVQRYLTTSDPRSARRALWMNVAASIPWAFIVFAFGTALFVFFRTHPERLNPTLQTDAIVPWFIVTQMPTGIAGLMIAALFAAAMSSLDSSIHSVATTLTVDFYRRFRPASSDESQLLLARWLTGGLGVLGTAAALVTATFEINSLWDLFLGVAGLAIGGLAGLFALGIFTRRANSSGAVIGAVSGVAVLYIVREHTDIHFLLYSAIGIIAVVAVGYVGSCVFRTETGSLDGLTIHTLTRDSGNNLPSA